jgi:hypothetical protein
MTLWKPGDGDGVALQATDHPIEVTEEMKKAGGEVLAAAWHSQPAVKVYDVVAAIYEAMSRAAPPWPEDISEEAVTEATLEVTLDEGFVETMAIQLAQGNNGGTWNEHYTAEHKEFWRQRVRDLWPQFKNAPFTVTFNEKED